MMPGGEIYTNRSDDELGTGEKTALSAIFGAVVTGVAATPGVAGVVVSAPLLLAGAAGGAGLYGLYAGGKWLIRKGVDKLK